MLFVKNRKPSEREREKEQAIVKNTDKNRLEAQTLTEDNIRLRTEM